jgi:AbrB family looped-hinge helix DNA binding protein
LVRLTSRIDKQGRVLIPKPIRRICGLNSGDVVEVDTATPSAEGNVVTIRKVESPEGKEVNQ